MNIKHLSRHMVIGLILLNSIHAFAQDAAPAADAVTPEQPKEAVGYDVAAVTTPANNIAAAPTVGILSPADLDVQTYVKAEAEAIKKDANDYATNQEACKSHEDKVDTVCRESRNPDIKKYLIISQVLMAGVSGMADACGKFGQVMDAGNKALTAYQAACSTWRGFCLSSCDGAIKNVQNIKKNLDILVNKATGYANEKIATIRAANPTDPTIKEYERVIENYRAQKEKLEPSLQRELEKKGDYMSVTDKKATCDGYAKELASSAVGLLSMAKSFGQANNCDKNTSNTPVANAAAVDCTLPENKQNNMTCICKDSPRTPGCSTGLDSSVTAKNADSLRSAGTSDYVPAKSSSSPGIDGGSGEANLASKSDGSGGSLPGAPSGGGAAGIDGGNGGGGGAPGSQGGGKASGLNTNILAGEGGGGGGGGGWGGSGSDGESRGLRQYLPGGAKDPRALAGQNVVSKEVTSQGGKSNWEKIRERYRDNKPSLLGY